MTTKAEVYGLLTTILCSNQHTFDDNRKHIRICLPLKTEDINGLRRTILDMFGNFHVPIRNPEDNPQHAGYKFDSSFIDTDGVSIGKNEHGQLMVIPNAVVEALAADDEFIQHVAEKLYVLLTNDCNPTCPIAESRLAELEARIHALEEEVNP